MSNDVVPVACINKGNLSRFVKVSVGTAKIFSLGMKEPNDTFLYSEATVTAMQAHIAELERDAARYRWLRDNPEHESAPYFDGAKWVIPRMTGNAGGIGGGDGEDRFDSLDTAIDAAIEVSK